MKIKEHATREEWLAARQNGIGGSDVAAIMGLSPWKTALDVWMERKAGVQPEESSQMRWGTKLEKPIADAYAEETGRKFQQLSFPLIEGPSQRMLASPDRIILGEPMGLECKAVGSRQAAVIDEDGTPLWGESGTDFVPMYYLLQVQQCLACTEFKQWDLAALLGGNDFRIYNIYPDVEIIGCITEAIEKFWRDHIEADVPPAPADEDQREKWLKHKYKKNIGKMLDADEKNPIVLRIIENLRAAKIGADNAKAQLAKCQNDVKELIGDFDGVSWKDEDGKAQKITWKKSKDGVSVDWMAVAEALNPEPALIEKYTDKKPGVRKLIVPRSWSKESDEDAE